MSQSVNNKPNNGIWLGLAAFLVVVIVGIYYYYSNTIQQMSAAAVSATEAAVRAQAEAVRAQAEANQAETEAAIKKAIVEQSQVNQKTLTDALAAQDRAAKKAQDVALATELVTQRATCAKEKSAELATALANLQKDYEPKFSAAAKTAADLQKAAIDAAIATQNAADLADRQAAIVAADAKARAQQIEIDKANMITIQQEAVDRALADQKTTMLASCNTSKQTLLNNKTIELQNSCVTQLNNQRTSITNDPQYNVTNAINAARIAQKFADSTMVYTGYKPVLLYAKSLDKCLRLDGGNLSYVACDKNDEHQRMYVDYVNTTIRKASNNYCLDDGGTGQNFYWQGGCNISGGYRNANQLLTYLARPNSGVIYNAQKQRCLDHNFGKSLYLYNCNADNSNQQWDLLNVSVL
jgi:hypothetical protein